MGKVPKKTGLLKGQLQIGQLGVPGVMVFAGFVDIVDVGECSDLVGVLVGPSQVTWSEMSDVVIHV